MGCRTKLIQKEGKLIEKFLGCKLDRIMFLRKKYVSHIKTIRIIREGAMVNCNWLIHLT
jgi:hypothetical protein